MRAWNKETFGQSVETRIKRWLRKALRGCDSRNDAADPKEIRAAILAELQLSDAEITQPILTALGIGHVQRVRHPTLKKHSFRLSGLICPGMLVQASSWPQVARFATAAELANATMPDSDSDYGCFIQ